MGVGAAIFESAGKRTEHYVPGVYSRSYNVTSPSGVSSGNLCILGSSQGGKPKTLLEFGSLADAKQALVGGDLLEAVGYAFNGSKDYVPQKVYAMRVNDGTQSSLELKSGTNTLMTLKAWDYGVHTNQLKMKIETGSTTGSKKITVAYKDSTIEVDNVQKKSFSILSFGTDATISISSTSINLKATVDETAIDETINFEDFPKLSDLIEKINTIDGFLATCLDTDDDALSANLDIVTSATLSETDTVLYSNWKAFMDAMESIEYIGSVEAGTYRQVPENMTYTYFTGGTMSAADILGWGEALEQLETEDIQILATPSTDSAVQTLISNHCTEMSSTVNRKERTCILGSAIGVADDAAIASATGFNSKLVSYVVDNAMCSNPLTGSTETISGAMLGVMLAGMESAMAVNIPLTNKTLNVLGFTKKRTISNMEKLIKGGVLVCNPSPDDMTNYVVIRGLTTYQTADLINNERSMVREDLYMNRDLRNRYSRSVGTPNQASTSSILSTLNDAGKDWADSGYIIPSDSNENVWNKSVKISGDKIYITYSRYLTAPTNFIFITATNHIYTSTVEV